MKKIVAALIMGLGVSSAANAADGTINFTGKVSSVTCSINNTTPNSNVNMNVTLPSVDVSSLSTVGAVSGSTPFQITLGAPGQVGCTDGSIASVSFETGAGVDTVTGLLKNTASTSPATNIGIALLNADDSSQIRVGSVTPNNHATAAIANSQATLNFIAAYKSTGVVEPGNVIASVGYSIIYN